MRRGGIRAWALALGALGWASAAAAAEYSNPILSGDWSDPGMIRVGDSFYTVRSSFGWQPGVPIAQSKDLVHWRYIGHAFGSLPGLQPGDTRDGIWGVELGYNPNTRQFLIYAPTRDYQVFVFSSDRPEGPYQRRSLGQHLGIDPGFFADSDGRLYLILNHAQIYELTADGLSIKRLAAQIDRRKYRYFEGPAIFRHGGWYYVLFSDGGTLPHQPSTVSVLRARAIEGPWEPDPHNPVLFSTDNGARFQGPAHGTLLQMPDGAWYVTFHAHEPAYYSLGRELLMQPIEWTPDGWWRPTTGPVPTATAPAPNLPPCDYHLAQSDDFSGPALGLQWFFTCPPDLSGASWSLTERPGQLRIHSLPGDLGALSALPGVFQQRVIDKRFSVETRVRFDAREGREAAGLHFYHDPQRNFWLASTVRGGRRAIAVGRYARGVRQDLWTEFPELGRTVDLKISVDGNESAQCFFRPGAGPWRPIGGAIYFGASGGFLRDGRKGDPDLGWVGIDKSNLWTAATFGVFAVRDGAPASRPADFDYVRVTKD
ncbi:MAG TPA: family 43 glycosylhydrolase [Opitutaceae bacterium]|nr:family 43 glycosylhydrolase [Opitutaceae bacterium]